MIEAIVVLFLVAVVGGGVLLLGKRITPAQMKLLLAFSAAYLLALSFLFLNHHLDILFRHSYFLIF